MAGFVGVIALLAAIVQWFYLPFAFGSLALLLLVISIMTSSKYRGLSQLTAVVASVGFVVGASIAVIMDNPLY
jgi:hypothetical protein